MAPGASDDRTSTNWRTLRIRLIKNILRLARWPSATNPSSCSSTPTTSASETPWRTSPAPRCKTRPATSTTIRTCSMSTMLRPTCTASSAATCRPSTGTRCMARSPIPPSRRSAPSGLHSTPITTARTSSSPSTLLCATVDTPAGPKPQRSSSITRRVCNPLRILKNIRTHVLTLQPQRAQNRTLVLRSTQGQQLKPRHSRSQQRKHQKHHRHRMPRRQGPSPQTRQRHCQPIIYGQIRPRHQNTRRHQHR